MQIIFAMFDSTGATAMKLMSLKHHHVAILGSLNTVAALVLANIAAALHDHPVFFGLMVMMALNLGFGINNLLYGIRFKKPAGIELGD